MKPRRNKGPLLLYSETGSSCGTPAEHIGHTHGTRVPATAVDASVSPGPLSPQVKHSAVSIPLQSSPLTEHSDFQGLLGVCWGLEPSPDTAVT